MDNIFDALEQKGIPYAVVVFVEKMKIKGMEANGRGYYIAILKRDKKKMLGYKFKQSSDYHRTIQEYDMADGEVMDFKNRIDSYTKVVHNGEGRVYELKTHQYRTSFKAEHEAYREEVA